MPINRANKKIEGMLKKINWGALTDAYSSADQLPHLIRTALSLDEDIALEALSEVYHRIFHQDILADIAPLVTPILVGMLDYLKNDRTKAYLLKLLISLASEFNRVRGAPGLSPVPESIIRSPEWTELARKTWSAICDGNDKFEDLLQKKDNRIRANAGALLSLTTQDSRAESLCLKLLQAIDYENNEQVRSSHLISLGVLSHICFASVPIDLLSNIQQKPDPAAAVAWVYAGGETPNKWVWDGLLAAGKQKRYNYELFPWMDGALAALTAEATLLFSDRYTTKCISLLLEILQYQVSINIEIGNDVPYDWPLPHAVSNRLVRIVFRNTNKSDLLIKNDLSKQQLDVLQALARLDCYGSALYDIGIPHRGRSLLRFLELIPSAPLDWDLQLNLNETLEIKPAWFWYHQIHRGSVTQESFVSALLSQWSKKDIFQLCIDLASGAYDPTGMVPNLSAPLANFLIEKIKRDIPEEIETFATELLHAHERPYGLVALVVIPLLELWQEKEKEFDESFIPLIEIATNKGGHIYSRVTQLLPQHLQHRF